MIFFENSTNVIELIKEIHETKKTLLRLKEKLANKVK